MAAKFRDGLILVVLKAGEGGAFVVELPGHWLVGIGWPREEKVSGWCQDDLLNVHFVCPEAG